MTRFEKLNARIRKHQMDEILHEMDMWCVWAWFQGDNERYAEDQSR